MRDFRREFTPEQIKRFLARDIIGHLPNASAIDLSQFAGLVVRGEPADDDDFAELRAQLRATSQDEPSQPFDVTLSGRWSDTFIFFKHEDAGKGPALAARLREMLSGP